MPKPADEGHDDYGDLARDVRSLSRRRVLGVLAGGAAGVALLPALASCGDDDGTPAGPDAATPLGDSSAGSCPAIPTETAGPYPGDGTNGANVLTLEGIVRRDIRLSVGSGSAMAPGVELSVTMTLLDARTCAPLVGRAIYLWHCDRAGDYSLYTGAAVAESYLRGVQVTDGAGQVTFTTIFPGCYAGRWPHMHLAVYESLDAATNGANRRAVSQLAFPKTSCDDVYATPGYETSAENLVGLTLETDGVFRDGATLQLPTMRGAIGAGLAAMLDVAV